MAIFKQTDDGLFQNPNDHSLEIENQQILKDIKDDTSRITSILDNFGGQAISRLKSIEKSQSDKIDRISSKLLSSKATKIENIVVNVPLKDLSDSQKKIVNSLTKPLKPTEIKNSSSGEKQRNQGINTTNKAVNVSNNVTDVTKQDIPVKSENINQKKTATNITETSQRNTSDRLRGKNGRFIKKNSDDPNQPYSEDEIKEESRTRAVIDAVKDVSEAVGDITPDNIDPTIDAVNEITDVFKTGKGFISSIWETTSKFFGNSDKDNKESRWRDKFFNFFKKSHKESTEQQKETNETLEDIKNNRNNTDSNGSFLKGLLGRGFGGLLAKGATIGGGILGKTARGAGKFAKGAFKRIPLLGAALSAFDIYEGLQDKTVDENGQSNGAKKIGSGVGSMAGMAIGAFGGPIGMVVGSVLGDIVGEKIGGWLSTVNWSDVGKTISDTWTATTEKFSAIWESAKDTFNSVWDSTVNSLKSAWDKTTDTVKDVWNSATDSVGNYINKRLDSAKKVKDKAANWLGDAYKNTMSFFGFGDDESTSNTESNSTTSSSITTTAVNNAQSIIDNTAHSNDQLSNLNKETVATRKSFLDSIGNLIKAVKEININSTNNNIDYSQYQQQGMGSSDVPYANATTFTAGSVSGLTQEQTNALMGYLSYRESKGDQRAENRFGYIGEYQFGASALADTGLINRQKLDAWEKQYGGIKNGSNAAMHKAFLADPSNWNNGLSKEQFLGNKQIQDFAMKSLMEQNAKLFRKLMGREPQSPEELASFLGASHLKGAGNAVKYLRDGKDSKDGFGTRTSDYALQSANAVRNAKSNKGVQTIPVEAQLQKATELPVGTSINAPLSIPSPTNVTKAVNNNSISIEQTSKQLLSENAKAEKQKKVEQLKANNKTNNKAPSVEISTLLTQDISDRKIAHIVTGGISGQGMRSM